VSHSFALFEKDWAARALCEAKLGEGKSYASDTGSPPFRKNTQKGWAPGWDQFTVKLTVTVWFRVPEAP